MMTPVDDAPITAPAKEGSWLLFALDVGPLWCSLYPKVVGMIAGTAAFMAAVIVSQVKLGKVLPMLWLSAVLVLLFGSLTLYFRDERFIQIKPTIIYAFFSLMLLGGWLRGRPLLKYLLGAAYKELSEEGWLKLSRNWGVFFLAMAVANEAMRASLSFDAWLPIKVWGITIVSMLFAADNVPMLLKHGLDVGEGTAR